ncbi:MAG: S8 family serine peptidase [Elusimicrobia bacterium]|nr:S8 family serine peptidase [Elusimicrobiota bacterium]
MDLGTPDQGPEIISNQILIKIKKESALLIREDVPFQTGLAHLDQLNLKHGAQKFRRLVQGGKKSKTQTPVFQWYKITLNSPQEILSASDKSHSQKLERLNQILNEYKIDSSVESASLNYVARAMAVPNDPFYVSSGTWGQTYSDLWGIRKTSPEPAWDQTTGSTSVIVADIDTGVDRNHEDLRDNMWVNSGEIPGNGLDDDDNGYVDDVYGWDYANGDNDPIDDHGHGTHTAGTIAATGNNAVGVVGMNWSSRIMALKILTAGGSGNLADAIPAMIYAADNGARVTSNSWGCACYFQPLDDAIRYVHEAGVVTVTAAGNSSSDAVDFYPASADMAITVAASDPNDLKANFSNWGEKIDVAAPGVDILSVRASTNRICDASRTVAAQYCRLSGTSMATPHVAGLAALLLSQNPSLNPEEVRQTLRHGADDLGSPGKDTLFGYGRINAGNTLALSDLHALTPIITNPVSHQTLSGDSLSIMGSIPGPNFASYRLEIGAGRVPTSWTTIATGNNQVIDGVLGTVNILNLTQGPNIIRLTATDTSGKTYQFQIHEVIVDNMDTTLQPFGSYLVRLGDVLQITGTASTKNGLSFSQYRLDYAWAGSPNSYSSQGISLVNGGLQPVENGTLGSWDTSGVTPSGTYALRLTLTSPNGGTEQVSTNVYLDSSLVSGWPKTLETNCPYVKNCHVVPAMGDMDGDGTKEVIAAAMNRVYVFRKDGSNFPGFPVSLNPTDQINWQVVVEDLDNDGRKEIIVQASVPNAAGDYLSKKIYVIRNNGTFYPGWPNPVVENTSPQKSEMPAIADLDGDGQREILLTTDNNTLHAFHANGSEMVGFSQSSDPYTNVLAVADMDGDGHPEIAVVAGGQFALLDNQGNRLPGWPTTPTSFFGIPYAFRTYPVFGDIDGDGNLEVFVTAGEDVGCLGCYNEYVYGWKKDGTLLPTWPKMARTELNKALTETMNPSAADIDNDGIDEILLCRIEGLHILTLTGDILYKNTQLDEKVEVSDLDGDGRLDFITHDNSDGLKIFRNDASWYWSRRWVPFWKYDVTPSALSDMDRDGKIEMAVASGLKNNSYDIDGTLMTSGPAILYLWELPGNTTGQGWPMFSHNPARTGRFFSVGSPDIQPPTINILSPLNGSTVSSNINALLTGWDNAGVKRVELWADGILRHYQNLNPSVSSFTVTLSWTAPAGSHTLQAKAVDTSDNVSNSPSITVRVPGGGGGRPRMIPAFVQKSNGETPYGMVMAENEQRNQGPIVLTEDPRFNQSLVFDSSVEEAKIVNLNGHVLLQRTNPGGGIVINLQQEGGRLRMESGLYLIEIRGSELPHQILKLIVVK